MTTDPRSPSAAKERAEVAERLAQGVLAFCREAASELDGGGLGYSLGGLATDAQELIDSACPSPDSPCFCECHRASSTGTCFDCRQGRHNPAPVSAAVSPAEPRKVPCPECGGMESNPDCDVCAGRPSVSPADTPEGETLDAMRRSLLDAMSASSEDNWCAGWMSRTEEMLHEQAGIWEILGRAVGWPSGYEHDTGFRWMTWDEAGAVFAERKRDKAEASAHQSLRVELANIFGPVKPREGQTWNEAMLGRIADVLAGERDRQHIERLTETLREIVEAGHYRILTKEEIARARAVLADKEEGEDV